MTDSEELKDVCRICLVHEAKINWNDEILGLCRVSYKDCYYKYTNLEEMDPDFYPSNLCKKCAVELKNAHILFEKALKSFKILQKQSSSCIYMDTCNNSVPAIKSEFECSDVVEELSLTLCENETYSNSVNFSNESDKATIKKHLVVEPTHFIDIHNIDLSVEKPLEEHFDELYGSKAPNLKRTRKTRRKRKNYDTIPESFEQTSDTLSAPTHKTSKRKKCGLLPEETLNKSTTAAPVHNYTSLEICKAKSAETVKRSREKDLLMCSYCSLKVNGAKKLETHEATHNENRERTVTCPECGLKLYTDLSLNVHMKIHDTSRQKNHKCEFCEKAFFNKGSLNVHRRIHLGLMIKCQICEKEFFRQVDLDKHLLNHSASPLERNVGKKKKNVAQCQYCNKSILTEKLKEHIAIHLNQPQVKCKICDKNFYSRTKCTRHLRRFHLKKLSEYEDLIHYYVDRNKRLSSLMIKQQLEVQPRTSN